MDKLDTECDVLLTEFINGYAEGTLDAAEHDVFSEYLASARAMEAFAEKSRKGKIRLNKAFRVRAADDFEEKLACWIARERELMARP